MERTFSQQVRHEGPYWACVLFIVTVFLLGGASRSDVPSLELLRPLSALFLVYGLWDLRRFHIAPYRTILMFVLVAIAVIAVQLVPLPPGIWHNLPGRAPAVRVDTLMGWQNLWRPLSMQPAATSNALFSLIVPLTMLVLVMRLDRTQRVNLLPVVLIVTLVSGLLGLVQVLGDPNGPLYFYQITNNGMAVGLFANRNHQALLLAIGFPLLAFFAGRNVRTQSDANLKLWLAISAAILLLPLVLVTGSRAGIGLSVLGLVSMPFVYRRPNLPGASRRARAEDRWRYLLAAIALVVVAVVVWGLFRANVLDRFTRPDTLEDQRGPMWAVVWHLVWKYLPFGSGFGSFVEVYQIDEPNVLLDNSYWNHAHNDFLELLMTGGVVALAMLVAGGVWWARAAYEALRNPPRQALDSRLTRLGSILVLMMALASVTDYPLRTPAMAALFILAACWMVPGPRVGVANALGYENNDGDASAASVGNRRHEKG